MPVLVGAMADRYDLDDLESGLVATAYFSTFALVALTSPLWIRRINWRSACLFGFVLMLGSLAVAIMAEDYSLARIAIACSGIGAGILQPVSLTLVSDMEETERVYAVKLAAEQLVPAILLVLMSMGLLLTGTLTNTLTAVTIIVALCLCISISMPSRGCSDEVLSASGGGVGWPALALFALGLSFAGFCGLWVFFERIAAENGFDSGFTAFWLAVGLITSGVGPLLAALVAERFGRVIPVLVSTFVAVAGIVLLASGVTEVVYATVLIILPLGYYFAISYIMSIVASVDFNGKASGLMSFALATGSAVGPALFGAVKAQGGPVLILMGALVLAGAMLIVTVARYHDRSLQEQVL
jgi:predicted MFS family arabinose efflux permease